MDIQLVIALATTSAALARPLASAIRVALRRLALRDQTPILLKMSETDPEAAAHFAAAVMADQRSILLPRARSLPFTRWLVSFAAWRRLRFMIAWEAGWVVGVER